MNRYLKFIFVILFIIFLLVLLLIFIPMQSEKTIHQILYPHYYQDRFPEKEFPPVANRYDYYERVREGYDEMKNSKIAILGLAYNLGEERTHTLMKRLSFLTKKFKDYRIIIYGADSDDYTFDILAAYMKFNPKIILPTRKIDKTGLNRIQKMCKLRNYVSKVLIQNDFEPDYVLFQDCDLASALSIDGIANSVSYMHGKDREYDAIFANGVVNEFIFKWHLPFIGYFYYDSFAFLEDPENPVPGGNKSIYYGRGEKPIPVKSAFGGAALYRYKVFKKFKYDETKVNMCEHISFNRQIYRAGYNLAINPSFLLISGRQGERFHKTSGKTHLGKGGYKELSITESEESFNIF